MNHAGAVGAGRERYLLGAKAVDRIEALTAAFLEQADEIDQHMGAARGRVDRGRVAQIGLHRVNLADTAERLQVEGQIGPAHGHSDAVIALGQRAHDVPAEET